MELGAIIKKYRLEKEITQEEMACRLCVTPQAVSRWENELSLPDITMIPKIVKCLGVSADILLGCQHYEQCAPQEEDDHDMLCQEQIDSIFGFPKEKAERTDTEQANIKTALIVDDAQIMRLLLCDLFSKNNYRVLSAADGKECLDLLKKEKADVCSLDIGMPEMNGLEVLKEIKRIYPETKVIMISAQSTKENVRKALELGAEHFMAKPFSSNNLLRILSLFE